ncbi:hypothetical protein MMC18_006668 [Xylographa bjoerkii]|nr:hypothetical protein [Xylographa bjoerkii]
MESAVPVTPDSSLEPKTEPEKDSTNGDNAQDVLTGFRLFVLFFAVLLAAFLMTLSGSILTQYTFVIFLGLFELGSLLSGASTSSNMLIVGRAIAGIGGAGVINGAISIITAATPMHKRPGKGVFSPMFAQMI